MNFLELAQQLGSDCSIQGGGPVSVLNQTSMEGKVVRWIREAYLELQGMPFAWRWLRETVRLDVVAGTSDYPLAGDWARPDIRSFDPEHAILQRADGQFTRLVVKSFDDFQAFYPVIDPTPGTPNTMTLTPDDVVRFNRVPEFDYTLQAAVKLAPQVLAADTDVPKMRAEFHSVIVHMAKKKYSGHDGDRDLWNAAESENKTAFRNLVSAEVPTISYRAHPLVR